MRLVCNGIGEQRSLLAHLNPLTELPKAIPTYRPGRDIDEVAGRASRAHDPLVVSQFNEKPTPHSSGGIRIRDMYLPVVDPDVHPLQLLGYFCHVPSYSSMVLKYRMSWK